LPAPCVLATLGFRNQRADVLNPIRSEQEAFRFLIYVAVAVAVIVAVVLGLRAIL
jgi:hypothetical protein